MGDQYWIAGQLAELGFGREARLLRLRPSCACKGTWGSNASPSAIESLKSATNGELPGTSPLSGRDPGLFVPKGTREQSPPQIAAWKRAGFSVWGLRQSLFRIARGKNLEIFPFRRGGSMPPSAPYIDDHRFSAPNSLQTGKNRGKFAISTRNLATDLLDSGEFRQVLAHAQDLNAPQ